MLPLQPENSRLEGCLKTLPQGQLRASYPLLLEPPRSGVRAGRSGIGATSPFARAPAKDRSPPKAALRDDRSERPRSWKRDLRCFWGRLTIQQDRLVLPPGSGLETAIHLSDDPDIDVAYDSSRNSAGLIFAGSQSGACSENRKAGGLHDNRHQQTPIPGRSRMGRRRDRAGRVRAVAAGPGGRELHGILDRRELG